MKTITKMWIGFGILLCSFQILEGFVLLGVNFKLVDTWSKIAMISSMTIFLLCFLIDMIKIEGEDKK